MNKILEIRQKIISVYYKIDAFVVPVIKAAIAFIILHYLNSAMGYNTKIANVGYELVASLLCSFLPTGVILLFAGIFSILHMYSMSMIVMICGVIVYLIVYLLLLRFAPKASLVVAVMPILMALKVPYFIPIVLGLVATPGSAIAVICGVIVYAFLHTVSLNASTITSMELSEAVDQLKIIVDGFLSNKGLLVLAACFAITIIVVYLVRRLPFSKNWEVAIGLGAVVEIFSVLIGNFIFDTGISVGTVVIGTVVGVVIGIILKFFKFCVDFPHTEKVQFEDDEYYYYVKAVPKISIGESSRKVKKINSKRHGYRIGDDLDELYDEDDEEYYGDENYSDSEDNYENFDSDYDGSYEDNPDDGEYYEDSENGEYSDDQGYDAEDRNQ